MTDDRQPWPGRNLPPALRKGCTCTLATDGKAIAEYNPYCGVHGWRRKPRP